MKTLRIKRHVPHPYDDLSLTDMMFHRLEQKDYAMVQFGINGKRLRPESLRAVILPDGTKQIEVEVPRHRVCYSQTTSTTNTTTGW